MSDLPTTVNTAVTLVGRLNPAPGSNAGQALAGSAGLLLISVALSGTLFRRRST
ncbi:hypothetical protein GCM10022223_59990 [Kineosporia mesophila]|uniref:LPXTG cell wall anchor domain-containing protein n=1 Tax=Kineosporia mesophila TaxID=566012 RepID=A0ABP7AJB2_9ACTN|nr:hypothetical protein [Kineosporia mesophila]MCD5352453.1 hypothetical protein [Kineosporia mesophila]